jgi:predicted metal-dependent phosphoesterase TrpH
VIRVRVAAHVHSAWSYDAHWSLPDIAAAFARRRYDVVLMSEHDRSFDPVKWEEYQQACKAASTDAIVLVPGIEYEDVDNVVHTPVWGASVPFLGSGLATADLLRQARSAGGAAVFAHPWRRGAIDRYAPEWAPLLSGVEIWNRKYDGVAPERRGREFADREGLTPFAALDFHTSRQFFPLAMAAWLGEPPSAASLTEAILAGRCRPELAGMSVLRFTRGLEGAAVRALESVRRAMRGPLRQLPVRRPG